MLLVAASANNPEKPPEATTKVPQRTYAADQYATIYTIDNTRMFHR
jgi:hypothetical protein